MNNTEFEQLLSLLKNLKKISLATPFYATSFNLKHCDAEMKAAEGGHLKKVEDQGDGIINPLLVSFTVILLCLFKAILVSFCPV